MGAPSWKQPKAGAAPTGLKQPKIVEDPLSYKNLKACWRVRSVRLSSPYGWHELALAELVEVQQKLAMFESMTWNEIFVVAKNRNHPIPVSDLRCPEARKWMAKNMPDQETLWTLRLSGAERVWGVLSGGAYQVVFWDPQHLIYPSAKK
jgi:hypothetical protein